MYAVLIFADNSVGIVHESWFVPPDSVLWPSCTTSTLYANLLKGTLPKCPLKSCTYEVYWQCKTFPDALSAQQEALDSGHTSSAGQNDERLVRQSRQKHAKKRLPYDFTDGSDRDSSGDTTLLANIVISPPTPKRLCTNPTATISSLIPVRDAPPVPRDAPMICGTSTCTTLPAVGDPAPRSSTLIPRTNSPNPKASVISPDLANLILKNLEKIYSSLQRLHMKIDARVPTSSSEALNEPPLPLSSMDDLQKYEEHLRDGPRYAQLVERWLLQEAGDVQVYLTNVLTRTLAPRLAVLLNWRGINDKKAFGSTRLAQGLIYAATEKFPNTNPRQVKEIVHRWLENERQKVRKRLQRATKNDK